MNTAAEQFLVHRVCGYSLRNDPVLCISSDSKLKLAAVARLSGCVEIWSTADWFLEGVIPASECGTVESVAWIDGRLFAVNLNGYVIELDTCLLTCKRKLALNGGAVFCIDVSGSQLVVGTADGLIALLETRDEQLASHCLTLQRAFPRQKQGIISIASYSEVANKTETKSTASRQPGESLPVWLIATGHADAVCIWDARRTTMLRRIALERESVRRPTMRSRPNFARCVRFIDPTTLVTGDSTGMVSFWDVSFGTQLKTFRASRADILSLAVWPSTSHQSRSGLSVFASGVENRITQFIRVERPSQSGENRYEILNTHSGQAGGQGEWVLGESLRGPHTHAVRALCSLSGSEDCAAVFSGGLDGRLVAWRRGDASKRAKRGSSEVASGTVVRLLDSRHYRAHVSLASNARIIMLQYNDRLELSRLAEPSSASFEGQNLTKLARIEVGKQSRHDPARNIVRRFGNLIERIQVRNVEPPTIVCSTISSDAQWIVYARSNQKLTVLRFVKQKEDEEAAFRFERARSIERALLTADDGEPAKYVSVLRITDSAGGNAANRYLFLGTRRGALIRVTLRDDVDDCDQDEDEDEEAVNSQIETRSMLLDKSGENKETYAFSDDQQKFSVAVTSIAAAGDTSRLLVGCSDHSLRLIDAVNFTQLGMLRHDDAARRPVAFTFEDATSSSPASAVTPTDCRTLVLYSDGALTEYAWRPVASQVDGGDTQLIPTETHWGRRVSRRAHKRSTLYAKLLRASACSYNGAQNADSRLTVWSSESNSETEAARKEPVVFYQTNEELMYFDKSQLFDLCSSDKKRKSTESAEAATKPNAKRRKLNEHNVLHVTRQYSNVMFAKMMENSEQGGLKELVVVEGLGAAVDDLPPAFAAKKFGM